MMLQLTLISSLELGAVYTYYHANHLSSNRKHFWVRELWRIMNSPVFFRGQVKIRQMTGHRNCSTFQARERRHGTTPSFLLFFGRFSCSLKTVWERQNGIVNSLYYRLYLNCHWNYTIRFYEQNVYIWLQECIWQGTKVSIIKTKSREILWEEWSLTLRTIQS